MSTPPLPMTRRENPAIGIVQRTRKSPYFNATVQAGVKGFSVYNHMLLPIYYESTEADYWHLMRNVTMWDVAVERQVEIKGPDAFHLVRLMTPRNLAKCKIGQCKYVPIIDERGGILNDPVLLRLAEDHFWLSLADSDILLYAKGLALGQRLNVDISEPDVSPLAIQGPRADDVAAALLGDWVRELRFFRFKPYNLDGIPLLVARSGWSKQGGVELYLRDGSQGERLWEMVATAGQPFDIKPATPSTIERIENGLLSYGNDMTINENPFEVGLGKYCDLDQPFDFIGKEALKAIQAAGVKRQLVGLVIGNERIGGSSHYWPVQDINGRSIGKVTSAVYSPRLMKNIAFGLLENDFTAVGTTVRVETEYGPQPGVVSAIPF